MTAAQGKCRHVVAREKQHRHVVFKSVINTIPKTFVDAYRTFSRLPSPLTPCAKNLVCQCLRQRVTACAKKSNSSSNNCCHTQDEQRGMLSLISDEAGARIFRDGYIAIALFNKDPRPRCILSSNPNRRIFTPELKRNPKATARGTIFIAREPLQR